MLTGQTVMQTEYFCIMSEAFSLVLFNTHHTKDESFEKHKKPSNESPARRLLNDGYSTTQPMRLYASSEEASMGARRKESNAEKSIEAQFSSPPLRGLNSTQITPLIFSL